MSATRVRERPDERVLIGHGRQSGEQFADLDARNARVDRRKRTAKIGPGFGLGIECFEMAGPSAEPNENHRRRRGDTLVCRLGPQPKQAGQAQTGKAPQADFEQRPTAAPLPAARSQAVRDKAQREGVGGGTPRWSFLQAGLS